MKVEITLPVAFCAEDYHEFKYWEKVFQKLNPKLKVIEVAFGPSESSICVYWAVVYLGQKPDEKAVRAALVSAGWDSQNELHAADVYSKLFDYSTI